MRVKSNEYLSDYFVNQFNIQKLKEVARIFIEYVFEFEIMINDEYFKLRNSPDGEVKVGGNRKPCSNKIESLLIMKYDTKPKMEEFILQYKVAMNNLTEMERKILKLTFVDGKSNFDICNELYIYEVRLIKIRNSAIVRFCLFLGLDKFTDLV